MKSLATELKSYVKGKPLSISLNELNQYLKLFSAQATSVLRGLPERYQKIGFEDGSGVRGDHVSPIIEAIKTKGLDQYNPFWGNDWDITSLRPKYDAYFLMINARVNGLRLHLHCYDLEAQLKPFIKVISEQTLNSFNGTETVSAYLYDDLSVKEYDELVGLDRKVKRVLNSDEVGIRGFSLIDLLNGVNVEYFSESQLGKVLMQLLTADNPYQCDWFLNKAKSVIHADESLPNVIIHNARTLYDENESRVKDRPRYMYDGFLKILTPIFLKSNPNSCCAKLNALDFYERVKNELPTELINDLGTAISVATLIKLLSRSPENKDLVLKSGKELYPVYQDLCTELDDEFF